MESYHSYTSSNNSDSFSSSSSSFQYQHALDKTVRAPPPHHSVRKSPAKSTITKKPMNAPLPPTRGPKIYKVDPVDFREVVQKLTGAAEFQTMRLQEAAPPPLSLAPPQAGKSGAGYGAISSPLGFSLSPSSLAWCSSFISSPRAISSLEPSASL
ncbi:hypothetical protein PHJA_002137600 [Phtheirospermum japonicum]|uniref:VQ domain-containing protein n=1 Tax=Phtheirospermum japonicum TaxID=374723 RepID=A0A830CXX8_9LAMI|nr:hypothetical protein PHJA_002137600 [Phtheirospermum japonicum]